MTGYTFIFGTLLFTVYGQLIIKWRIHKFGQLPADTYDKIKYLFTALIDPYVLSGFLELVLINRGIIITVKF